MIFLRSLLSSNQIMLIFKSKIFLINSLISNSPVSML